VPVIEVGLVVGYLTAWAVRKARRTGNRLDKTADLAVDVSMDRLDGIVRAKLEGHPALHDLDDEATALANDSSPEISPPPGKEPQVWATRISDLTRRQLELALESAVTRDPAFSQQLDVIMAQLQAIHPTTVSNTTVMEAKAYGQGRVYQAGHDLHITE
jgi:hypothetical protein